MYVAISQALLSSVEARINDLEKVELQACPIPHLTISGRDPLLVTAGWGQHAGLLDAVPDEWCSTFHDGAIHCFFMDGDATVSGAPNFHFKPPFKMNPSYQSRYLYASTMKIDLDKAETPELVELREILRTRYQIGVRWCAVRKQVVQFLETCKSLNEAIKLWPDVVMYVPESYAAKVSEKATRAKGESKALEMLKEIDTDAAAAAFVTARMLGAKN